MGNTFAFLSSAQPVCQSNSVPTTIRPTVSFDGNFAAGFVKSRPFGPSAQPASQQTARLLFFTLPRETRPSLNRKILLWQTEERHENSQAEAFSAYHCDAGEDAGLGRRRLPESIEIDGTHPWSLGLGDTPAHLARLGEAFASRSHLLT